MGKIVPSNEPCADGPMVSILVPVYNVENYLEECLDSLLAQQCDCSFEVILIENGSTDGSPGICDRYADRHEQVFSRVISTPNAGVSCARNLGLERARGRYLMFVDADDRLPDSAMASLVEAAERHQADVVKGNIILFDKFGQQPAPDWVRRTTLVEGDEVLVALYRHEKIRGHVGGKLYRRERFGDLRFKLGIRMAEDLLFFTQLFARAHKLVLIKNEVYRYRKHDEGASRRKYDQNSYLDWLQAIHQAGVFASTARQKSAYKHLVVRSMAQIAREVRKLPPTLAAPALGEIERRLRQWNVRLPQLVFRDRLSVGSISRYIKMQLALKQIRRKLSQV